jgi:translocator protein
MSNVFNTLSDVTTLFILTVIVFTQIFYGSFQMDYYEKNSKWYDRIAKKIIGMPPSWVFPIAWTIIYCLIVISLFIFYRNVDFSPSSRNYLIDAVSFLFLFNIMINKMWTYVFFQMKKTMIALIMIIVMIITGLSIIVLFGLNGKWVEFGTFLPYVLWCFYACYLNSAWVYYEK